MRSRIATALPVLATALMFLGAAGAGADQPPSQPSTTATEPGVYIVQPGDTCLDVAKKVWPGDPDALDRLHDLNAMGPLPHNLVPGMRLRTISNVPDATVAFVKPDVNVRKAGKSQWDNGKVGEGLFHLDQLATLAGAAAEVLFRDRSTLQLDENALITIFDTAASSRRQNKSGAIELVQGDLRLHLAAMRGETSKELSVKTPAASVDASNASLQVEVDKQKMSRVSVFDGSAAVSAKGQTVDVRHGFGTRVAEGTSPEEPQPLPPAPAWTLGGANDLALALQGSAPVSFRWGESSTAIRYRLEVATDDKFNARVIDRYFEAKAARAFDMPAMPLGRFYVRVSAFNAAGLVGPPSVTKQLDVTPLRVEAGRPGRKPGTIRGAVQVRIVLPKTATAKVDGQDVPNPVIVTGLGSHRLEITIGDAVMKYECLVDKPRTKVEFAPNLRQVIVRFFDTDGHPASFMEAPELGIRGLEGTHVGMLTAQPGGHEWRASMVPFQSMSSNFGAHVIVTWDGQPIGEMAK